MTEQQDTTTGSPEVRINASTFVIPSGQWPSLLDCLAERFPRVGRDGWLDRFARGLVQDAQQQPLAAALQPKAGMKILYYRENKAEQSIPVVEEILYQDDNLLVADKPHFLPVIPTGGYVTQTLLARLITRTGNRDLQPLHRLDRHTAGLVLFSTRKETRGLYQALFREQSIDKSYEALAPPLPELVFPYRYSSRIVRGEPFFLSQQVGGEINAETLIEVIGTGEKYWHYALTPITGKKHQLRLHMAALGAPIVNDFFYPQVIDERLDDFTSPLQLIARRLAFVDPISQKQLLFTSNCQLLAD